MSDRTRLHDLADAGQSPWMDNLRRGWLTSGELASWIDRGIRCDVEGDEPLERRTLGRDRHLEPLTPRGVRTGAGRPDVLHGQG